MLQNIKLLICKHGDSIMKSQNKFSGWVDSPLNRKGITQSFLIAEKLQKNNLIPHTIFTSNLIRTIQTGEIIKNYLKYDSEILSSWRLNEKHFGILEGLDKTKAIQYYSNNYIEQIKNDYYTMPYFYKNKPLIDSNLLINNSEETKIGESNNMLFKRFLPLWDKSITNILFENKTLLIISHKYLIKSIISYLENIDKHEYKNISIEDTNIIYYELNNDFNIVKKDII